jgi:predicted phage terminase large subunit-like protein
VSAPVRTPIAQAAADVLAIDHLADFVRQAWPIVEMKAALTWNWHIDLICAELEAVTRRTPMELRGGAVAPVRELVICVPPGRMKSLLVSVFWPAWAWLASPEDRTLFFSNDDALVVRDSRRTRQIITSDWYQRLIAITARDRGQAPWTLAADQNEKVNFETSRRGFRQCMSIGAAVTGKRGDGQVIDDPYDAKEALVGSAQQVRRRMKEVVDIYEDVLADRLNDRATGWRVVIMQRLHEDDLAGVLLARDGVRSVVLPTEYEPKHPNGVHAADPRRTPGELLFPKKFPADVVAAEKRRPRAYAAKQQQRPAPDAGGLFQRPWFQHIYEQSPERLAASLDEQAITVDCTFKKGDDTDFVVMQVWGRKRAEPARKYLLDQVRARMTFTETVRALRKLCEKWPHARMKLVEDKANGTAVIDTLKAEIPGIVAYDPKASKEARAQIAAVDWEAGDCWLPAVKWCPWIGEFEEEHCAFPGGPHDDQVDAASQLLIKWGAGGAGVGALEKVQALNRALAGW